MHLGVYVFLILFHAVSVSHGITCTNRCDCTSIQNSDLIVVNGVDDCCDATATPAKGNINQTNGVVTGCSLCSSCGNPTCRFNPITTVYSANITRPAGGKTLFMITGVTFNCSNQFESILQLFYFRGSTSDDIFTTVNSFGGTVKIVLANPPTVKRTYTGFITIQLLKDLSIILAETSFPFTFVLYDAIESDAVEYTATATNSRVGGLYLFTAGTNTPGFTVVFSIRPGVADFNSIFINSTSGAAFTSTVSPPTAIRTYQGLIVFTYTSDSGGGSPTNGQIEVLFNFDILSPITPSPLHHSVMLAFPLTPRVVTAFIVSFNFEDGFSYSSFLYDFIDGADLLNINHLTRTFSFPFESDTEVKRYPDSGVTNIVISYFSLEMFTLTEQVYKGTLIVSYDITVVDPCGFSFNVSDTCVNGGTCTLDDLSFICDCPVAFNGTNCEIDVNECLDTDFCNTGSCANTYGGFICTCTSGFTGVRCVTNVDECLIVPSVCLNGGVCSDSIGSYSCDCFGTGYSGINCEVNINECVKISNLCGTGVCHDNNGSYVCACNGTGFRGDNCGQDINECTERPGICQNNGLCINTNGSYICDCTNTGFLGDNCETNVDECNEDPSLCQPGICVDNAGSYSCNCTATGFTGADCTTDIDECNFNSSTACLNAGVCSNTNGGFTCDCTNTGYKGLKCAIDVNECLIAPPVCENTGNCFNTVGSYSCNCNNTGYIGNNCETNINECNVTSNICSTGQCIDTEGDYICNCNGTGFVGENCHIDVNECNLLPPVCLNNGVCSNSFGRYSCNCSGTGYSGAHCGTDINECTQDSTVCNNGTCNNTNGSYNCDCTTGFTGVNCESDIDECDTADICNNGTCSNTPGSFNCSCDAGYNGELCDNDVNECSNVTDLCSDGICVNSIGSYSCDCIHTGYRGDNCRIDINECAENTTLCNQGNCTNTNGSFFCTCFSGFTGSYCSVNINECDDTADLCNNGTCVDTQGSYECECPSGITGNNCEEDINECLDLQLCTPGICNNIIGSYTCNCTNTGFEAQNCTVDINECTINPGLCGTGTCINVPGSFSCNCTNTGFEAENCTVDINECTINPGLCGTGTCINVPGSFSCNCTNTGFTGTLCLTDIDECTTLSPCQNSGNCFNIPGSYLCDCNSTGFTGTDCDSDINECVTTDICNFGTCINIPGTYSCNCQSGYTGPDCTILTNATALCPSDKVCTNDSECAPCLCHRNFTYLEPVYVLLSEPLTFNEDILLPFEREIQPELVGDVTIYAKLNQNSNDQGYVMFIGSSTSYRNLGLFLDSNVSTVYLFYTQAGATSYTTIEVSLDVSNSIHTLAVVLNFTGGLAHFYKDGTHEMSVSLSGPPDYKLGERRNSRVMYVGGRIENLFKFKGWIECLFLYLFCLTSSQIQYLHQNGPISYSGEGICKNDITSDTFVPRPFYKPSVPTQHHLYASKTRCDISTHYSARSLTGAYTCSPSNNAVECSTFANCASGYACGEYLSRDGYSFLPAVFDPYFHGFKYALVETETTFNGANPITISITKRPILTLDLTIFVKFKQNINNEGYVVAKGVSAHARDFGLYLRGTSDSVWFVYKSKSGFHDYAIFYNITVDDGQTHTMAAVLLQADNSRFVYLYVDGLPRGCVKINNRVVFTPEINSLTVGGRPGTNKFNFNGVIYKLHIFDVALTFSVISDLHKAFTKNLLVRYCTHLQTSGDSCYIESRPPFFKCGSDLGCVPTPYFNRSIPVLPQQNISYGAPYTFGQCLSCDCPTPTSNQLVCGINGVTYADSCFLACGGTSVLSQGACESYEVRFSSTVTGE